MATIGDRATIIVSLLGGRTDLAAQISQWLANSYRDLASTVPFEELEDSESNLTVSAIGSYDYPATARAIKSLTLVQNTAPIPLWKRNMTILDRYPTTVGLGVPSIWAPFGRQYFLRPVPNDSYELIVRFWQQAVIDPDDVNDTELKVPQDWLEIIDYQAQMRGYTDLQEPDKAAAIRNLLYGQGDPRKPGLIKQRLTRIQAEYSNANYGMRPRITRYGNVR